MKYKTIPLTILLLILTTATLTANETTKTEWEINAEARARLTAEGPLVVPFYLSGYLGFWVPDETQRLILEDLYLYDLLKNEKHPAALQALSDCEATLPLTQRKLTFYKWTAGISITLTIATVLYFTIKGTHDE